MDRKKIIIFNGARTVGTGVRKSLSFREKYRGKQKNLVVDERYLDECTKEAVTAVVTEKEKSEDDVRVILKALRGHFIFKNLDADDQLVILESVKHYSVGPREIIFKQGQPGANFFCVVKGSLEVICNGEKTAVIESGTSFGELALLDDSPRTATIKTIEACSLWGVDRRAFNEAIKKLNALNYEENKQFINSIFLFDQLNCSQKESLLASLVTQKWACGKTIIKEGENGNLFYIIKEGVVGCYEKNVEKRVLHKGDYFGEQALLNDTPRTATIIAMTDVKIISICRKNLMQVLGNSLEHILYKNSMLITIDKSPVLRGLNSKQSENLITNLTMSKYNPEEIIVKKGSFKNSKLIIIVKGSASGGVSNFSLYSAIGDSEIAANDDSVYPEDIIANELTDTFEIRKHDLESCIGGSINHVALTNEATSIIKNVHIFKGLPFSKVYSIAKVLKLCRFEDGQVIVSQDSVDTSFYIIKSGLVKIYRNEVFIRDMTKHDYFGERAALSHENRSATVIANGTVEVWVLFRENFINIIDEKVKDQLEKRMEYQDLKASLHDLMPVKVLGAGKFGNVILTLYKDNCKKYALKSVLKSKIEMYGVVENIRLEKQILMLLDHPFIMRMIKTIKDELRVYFLVEYVRGMDLFDILLDLDLIKEDTARFYIASFLLTIEHLHERSIMHRDLKPENIIIDEEGYPKIIDFGIAKIVKGRSYTTVGTPHYMAPEIILKTGYDTNVDLWSIGVIMYEIIFGKVPFGADDDEPKMIYDKILEHKLDLSSSPYDGSYYKTLIQQLLSVNPYARLGGSIDHLKNHPWFANYNWDRLITRQSKAPFVPIIARESLISCTVSIHELLSGMEKEQFFDKNSESLADVTGNWDEDF